MADVIIEGCGIHFESLTKHKTLWMVHKSYSFFIFVEDKANLHIIFQIVKPAIFIISAQNAALNLRSAVNNSLSSPMRHTHLYVLNSTFLPWIEGSSFGESKCFHFEIVHAISQIDKRYKGMWASVSRHWSDVEK